jgi:hypothetical protein
MTSTLPETRIETAELITTIIHKRFDGTVDQSERPHLAQMLGHKTAQSGAFNAKLADLGKYGLTEGRGKTTLTSRGRDLIRNPESALTQILSSIPLFEAARAQFGDELPMSDEWAAFVDSRPELTLDDSTEQRSRKIYNGIVGQLPRQSRSSFSGAKFDRYYRDIDEEDLRDLCLEALREITDSPIPSIEYFDKIHGPIAELFDIAPPQQDVPFDVDTFNDDQTRQLLAIFAQICTTSSAMIKQERGAETVELAVAIVEKTDTISHQRRARRILEAMDPMTIDSGSVEYLWDLTLRYLRESYTGAKGHKRDTSTHLYTLLTEHWATDDLLDKMEVDIYEELKQSGSHEYRSHLQEWHAGCR